MQWKQSEWSEESRSRWLVEERVCDALTPGVDPERDAAVALGQVRTFEAVFVLEAAVGLLLRGRAARGDVRGDVREAVAVQQGREDRAQEKRSDRSPARGHRHVSLLT